MILMFKEENARKENELFERFQNVDYVVDILFLTAALNAGRISSIMLRLIPCFEAIFSQFLLTARHISEAIFAAARDPPKKQE